MIMLYALLFLVNFLCPGLASTKITPAVFIELSHEKVVIDLSDEVSIKCTTNATELETMGWTALDKLIIEREEETGPPRKLASIDHAQSIRGERDDVVLEGRIEQNLTAWLKMTYRTAVDETAGNMRCLVTGYDNYYEANWLEDFTPYARITATDVSMEAVVNAIKYDKKIIKETGKSIADASKWVQTFSKYMSSLNSRANMYLEHWPKGNYALPKPTTGCPADMPIPWTVTTSQFTLARRETSENKLPDHFERPGLNIVKYSFCKHESGGHYSWPKGDYCIHPSTVSSRCPTGFEIRDIDFGHLASDFLVLKAADEAPPLKSALRGKEYLTVRFCCRNDGLAKNPVLLPTQVPFYLYQGQSGVCQEIMGDNHSIEELTHNVGAPNLDSFTHGAASKHENKDGILRLCYYTSTGPHNYEEQAQYKNLSETTRSPRSTDSQTIKTTTTRQTTTRTSTNPPSTTTEPPIETTKQTFTETKTKTPIETTQLPIETTEAAGNVTKIKQLKTPLPLILRHRHFNDPKKNKIQVRKPKKSQIHKKPKPKQKKEGKINVEKSQKRRGTKTKNSKHTKETKIKRLKIYKTKTPYASTKLGHRIPLQN